MNKIYDKLLIAIAVLLLAGGVFLYLQKTGQVPSLSAPAEVAPAQNPYVAESVVAAESTEASWPAVPAQSTGWRFDVFTPPKIFIDANGQFTQVGWEPPEPKAPFGIYLADIVRKPYRLQFEGYIEEDRSDPSKTLLLLFNEEAQQQVRARPGDEKAEAEFKVIDFDINRIRDADNNIEVVAKASILDQRTGETVVLTHGEREFDDGVTVILRSEGNPAFQKELSKAPAEFEGPLGQYKLVEINLEDSSVTVEKQASEDEESESRVLSVRSGTPAPTSPDRSPNRTNEAQDNDSAVFDFNF
jgi:hypothetical protein